MQLTKKIFPDSAIFIEKKRVENRVRAKSEFLWAIFFLACIVARVLCKLAELMPM